MIIKDQFPQDPTDGMLFETVPGVLYRYNKGQNAWIRLEGESARPATPLAPGLMSAEDLKKLNTLILPPPQTSISIEGQAAKLQHGTIDIYSLDRSIEVTTNPTAISGKTKTPLQWAIHENTAGIDIRLNMEKFIADIESLGKLKKVQMAGLDGPQGPIGEDGEDNVETGPVGEKGVSGDNAPFVGNEASETVQFDVDNEQSFRAVVDIETERVSDDENYLVLTRANVGNPGVCPTTVKPKELTSSWLLVIDESDTVTTRRVETSDGQLTCRICTSSLFYVNVDTIIATIKDRFAAKLSELKLAKESAVREWLRTMATVFNEQKYALCCALNNCNSRKRNAETRRYIEEQRIQAVQGDHSLIVDTSDNNKVVTKSKDKCPIPDEIDHGTDGRVVYKTECNDPLVTVRLDAALHSSQPQPGIQRRWLTANIPAGDYVLEVLDCCANLSKMPKVEQAQQPKPVRPKFAGSRNPPYFVTTLNGQVGINDINIPITDPIIQLLRQQATDYIPCIGVSIFNTNPLSQGVAKSKVCNDLFYKQIADFNKLADDEYAKARGWVDNSTLTQTPSSTDQFSGVVSIQYQAVLPVVGAANTTVVTQTTSIPNLGVFNDQAKAKTTYVGTSTAFSHAGGEVQLWIDDPDGIPTNNAGEIVIGIRSRKCVEVVAAPAEPTAGEDLTYLYVYRDAMSLDTLIGKIRVYETAATQHENYGFDGTGPNIVEGPEQEDRVTKTFFVRASDGLAFYMVNHINGVALTSRVTATLTVEGNNSPLSSESNNPGEVVNFTNPDAEIYQANWQQNANADGLFINNMDDNIGDSWQIELDASDFGETKRLTANGADDDEFVLAQGTNGGPIATSTESSQFLLCRALRRACNVPEGFGGRYSLGIINRKPGVPFRVCKTMPDWTLGTPIQREITYAPAGYPCGCTVCDVKYQKTVGVYDCSFTPRITGDKVDIVYCIDVSGSMRDYDDLVPDFLDKFAEFMAQPNGIGGVQPSQIRYALITFGGHAGKQGHAAPRDKHRQGDPFIEQDFTVYTPDGHHALTDKIRNNPFKHGPAEPTIWTAQFAASGMNWDPDAIHCIVMISNEEDVTAGHATSRKGVNRNTAIQALTANNVIFNAITTITQKLIIGDGDDLRYGTSKTPDPYRIITTRIWRDLHPLADATGGSANFEIREILKGPQSENFTGWIYDQPFKNFRIGIDVSEGGITNVFAGTGLKTNYRFGGVPGYFTISGLVRGPDAGFDGALVQLKSSATGTTVISTSITDETGTYQFRIPSEFFPKNSKKEITFTIEAHVFSVQANDPWDIIDPDQGNKKKRHKIIASGGGFGDIGTESELWKTGDRIIENTLFTTNGSVMALRAVTDLGKATPANPSLVSDGFYPCAYQRILKFEVRKVKKKKQMVALVQFADSATNPDFSNLDVQFVHDTTPCATKIGPIKPVFIKTQKLKVGAAYGRSNAAPYQIVDFIIDENTQEYRGIIEEVNKCRETFFQTFKRTKFNEIFIGGCSDTDKATYYNNGPSTKLTHVAEIPMTQETLDGTVIAITASILALPNLSVRPVIFNDRGQGLVLQSKAMSAQSTWESHTWRLDEIDRLVIATDPQGDPIENGQVPFALTDLKYVALEFVNPPTGRIAFIGQVQAAVERVTPTGRETIMVEIANFEPFKSSISDPGEIPLVEWIGGTPTENDFSNYLECYWTIAESGNEFSESVCTQLREYCPDCNVVITNVPTEAGLGTVKEVDCNEKNDAAPLSKYIFTPLAPGDACLMHYKQVIWYNRGWRIGACCGAKVDIDGQKWLIVKRSFGTDVSCGGGESHSTRCITQFIDRGEGHPAIAWPSLDGEEFTGIPLSGFARLIRDTTFSDQLREKLAANQVDEFRGSLNAGNAIDTIPFILFPSLD
jgi:hypothetical protein